jgi:DNA polymerase-3 subunit gamma/tau
MVNRLKDIASRERLEVDEAALDLIARQSTGSMRDAESLLDQLASYGGHEITLDQVQAMLGLATSQAVKDLVDHVASRDVAAGLDKIGRAVADGADTRQLNKDLLGYLRGLLLLKTTGHGPSDMTAEQQSELARQAEHFTLVRLVRTIKLFSRAALDVKGSTQPQLPLELSLVEAALPEESENKPSPATAIEPAGGPSQIAEQQAVFTPEGTSPEQRTDQTPSDDGPRTEIPMEGGPPVSQEASDADVASLRDVWSEVVASINRSSRNLAAVVRDCPPVAVDEDLVTLCARSHFHKEQLESDEAKELVGKAIDDKIGQRCRVRCVMTPDVPTQSASENDLQELTEDPVIKAGLELGGEIGTVR